jgi:hypothetical protein
MAKAKHASTVGVHLANTVLEELDRRAKLLGYSRSKYAAALITRWYSRGAKPVFEMEREKLDPIVRPDGSLTWVGAGLKPGATITAFASDDAAREYPHAAEGPAEPILPADQILAEEQRRRRNSKTAS